MITAITELKISMVFCTVLLEYKTSASRQGGYFAIGMRLIDCRKLTQYETCIIERKFSRRPSEYYALNHLTICLSPR